MIFSNAIEIIFFILLLIILNSYVFYIFIIKFISYFHKAEVNSKLNIPKVSIIISAYNEEKVIKERIINISELDYPKEKIEILIGSDGSVDKTNEILKEQSKKITNLRIFIFNKNRGKAKVLNDLVKEASNEFLVFTDANTVFEKKSLKNLMNAYYDKTIGGVSGRLILKDDLVVPTESVEEKQYWAIETNIKKAEGKCGILIGANGGIFSIRKSLFTEIPITKPVTDDLFVSLTVLAKGYKFVYAIDAIATEDVGVDVATEYKRKVRFAATNYQTLVYFTNLLFSKNLLLAYAFWSHKVIRWISPILIVVIFILNIILFNSGSLYKVLLILQIVFYSLSLIGYIFSLFKTRIKLFSLPFFFIVAHIALIVGFSKFIRKKHSVRWESTKR